MPKLPFSYFQNSDVNFIAKDLLGKYLFTSIDGIVTAGIITETEAYKGIEDKASHAYGGRFTNRTQTMYEEGGLSYVYLCYGIHYLFNVVTGAKGVPHAVLIRGLEPSEGLEHMLERRKMTALKPNLAAGPGALAKAMGIDKNLNGADLQGEQIWIEDRGLNYNDDEIIACPRVGVAYADDHALLPWRYYVRGNKFVSRPNNYI
ncbi:MAG: DNA-3-methyladenine glycosylase [Pedobacter sp.]|nr:MAG: DNA-3-methyladenine glycosylase [Pedobacter sp.]